MRRASLVALAVLASAAAGAREAHRDVAQDGWRTFGGTWSASGTRHEIPAEGGRRAAVLLLSGAIVITDAQGIGRGFLGEAVGFDDGHGTSVGRAVWTDADGNRIYSSVTGEGVQTGRRVAGVFTGGSGRYTGVTGGYAFTWQYVSRGEEGRVQGRTTGFSGRFRLGGDRR